MSDKQTELMLQAASLLTAEDLDSLRSTAAPIRRQRDIKMPDSEVSTAQRLDDVLPAPPFIPEQPRAARATQIPATSSATPSVPGTHSAASRGDYERQRSRESKISTACVGREREKHEWWPVGTELIGHMGGEAFTAQVIENPHVKSGRSLLLTSGSARGKVCITPTRAAIEATEDYRQGHNMGRGGGVTNGWDFWKVES